MVGELRYEDQPHGQSSMVCLLMPVGSGTDPLVQMFHCRIKIEKRGVLIRGTEYVWQRKRRDGYTQTVWAWPIPAKPMTIRVIPPRTSAIDELREAVR